MVKLDNWSFVSNDWRGRFRDPDYDEFQAPVPGSCLHGFVTGHPKIQDGHRAHTSKVEKIEYPAPAFSNRVTTVTGTIYSLGKVNPLYHEWMRENGWDCAGAGWF